MLRALFEIIHSNMISLFGGGRISIEPKTRISFGARLLASKKAGIRIGAGTKIREGSYLSCVDGKIEIGCNCSFNRNITMVAMKGIIVGDNCSFGPGVTVYDHDHKFNHTGRIPGFNCSEVVIGNNCWLGANVTVLRGVRIGNNCVVGAGCIIKEDIADNMLVVPDTTVKQIQLTERNNR